ncbi:MAG: FRG domain-containing protein [Firmicutes bacterium]|nr:FRG domain-containing protein [Bacillota bacterium]
MKEKTMKEKTMKEKTISSLSQLIDAIEKLKSYYPSGIMLNNPVANTFLYRGLSDVSYKLIPSVFRKKEDNIDGRVVINNKYLAWANEKSLLLSFIHEASGLLSISTNDLPRWAEYAQHYGVPTRFLDWSSNPLVALYFACRDRTEQDGAIWMLHGTNYKRFLAKNLQIPKEKTVKEILSDLFNDDKEIDYPVLYTPYYVDARMSAQKSYFLVWGAKKEPLEDMLLNDELFMELPEVDNGIRLYGDDQQNNILFKFFIHADSKQPLLHELDMVGINEKTLFPGLDGIGRYVERQYRFDYNETIISM